MDLSQRLPARSLIVHDRAYRVIEVPSRSYPIRIIEAAGDADDRPAIVMIHGMEESWEVWERITPHLEAHHRLVRLDMPWSGTLGYDWTAERETVAGWLKCALDAVPAPITALIGHSFGAMATLDYLDLYGVQELRAAALISPFRLDEDGGRISIFVSP